MKRIIILITALSASLAACNNATTEHNTNTTKDNSQAATATTTAPVVTNEITDPVCGMVKDGSWTDYTLYKGDTVWFCAAAEKTAFEAHPEKYAGNIKKH
jgi:YHS domain-containing protein